jgi:miniconductance mechanosensitive channel
MERIKNLVEHIIVLCGLTGESVAIVRHVLLVLATVLLAASAGWFCKKVIVPMVIKLTARSKTQWDSLLLGEPVLRSACQVVPAIVVWILLPSVFYQFPTVRMVLTRITAIYITVMMTRTVIVFINSFKNLEGEQRTSTQQYLYTLCDVLKIVLILIATIVVVAITIDKSPATLLAGLGATSAIMMLVFQDTITGLVAGVRLTSNDMLRKGDWITLPKSDVNGIVEDITLTTVKVRNFDNTIMTVPPKTLVNDVFQNWKGMRESGGRKVTRQVYFDFRHIQLVDDKLRQKLSASGLVKEEDITAETVNLTLFRRYMEQWLAQQPTVNPEMTIMVRQAEATQQGLAVEFVFFLLERGGAPFEHAISDIMEYVFATAPRFGLSIYQLEHK